MARKDRVPNRFASPAKGYSLTCAPVVATPAAGTFAGAQSVTLVSASEDADIYYTTNGSAPNAESTKYTTAIAVAATTTIKAIAIKAGVANSAVFTGVYTIGT